MKKYMLMVVGVLLFFTPSNFAVERESLDSLHTSLDELYEKCSDKRWKNIINVLRKYAIVDVDEEYKLHFKSMYLSLNTDKQLSLSEWFKAEYGYDYTKDNRKRASKDDYICIYGDKHGFRLSLGDYHGCKEDGVTDIDEINKIYEQLLLDLQNVGFEKNLIDDRFELGKEIFEKSLDLSNERHIFFVEKLMSPDFPQIKENGSFDYALELVVMRHAYTYAMVYGRLLKEGFSNKWNECESAVV